MKTFKPTIQYVKIFNFDIIYIRTNNLDMILNCKYKFLQIPNNLLEVKHYC